MVQENNKDRVSEEDDEDMEGTDFDEEDFDEDDDGKI